MKMESINYRVAVALVLAWVATLAVPSMMAVKANGQKRNLETALDKARAGLQAASESLDEIGEQAQQANANTLETVRRAEILKKMTDENTGVLMLSAGIIGDLSSTVEIQKSIIGRGTPPTIEEGEKLRQLEIGTLSAMKSVSVYIDRMKALQADMVSNRK